MFGLKTLVSRMTLLSLFILVAGGLPANTAQNAAAHLTMTSGVTFANSGQSLGGETGNDVALGDLDGDGDTDAFVANDFGGGEANHVWFNQGNGFFISGPALGTFNGNGVALGDLDDDGDLDGVVAGTPPPSLAGANLDGPGSTQLWLNQGGIQGGNEGTFALGQSFGLFSEYGAAVGDIDNDDDLDVLVQRGANTPTD